MVFVENGAQKSVVLERKPLGFAFMSRVPIVVTRVNAGGVAEAAGLKVGMELVSIGGEAVGARTYTDLYRQIIDSSAALPTK
mmetsp:Transcript_19501/g.44978  ORF Transcript_19501/g.44978 Transcript_19501/m.44978 type:complete len:82 (+) Transcript_19501:3-248(+)